MEIAVRIPEWSAVTTLKVNGETANGVQSGDYAKINRAWKTGDKISLELDMRGRLVESGTSVRSIAIMRGPLVLARDSRFDGVDLESVLTPVVKEKKYVDLTFVQPHKGANMTFQATFIPESYREGAGDPVKITLCDYASAGNDASNSYYKVWLPQLINRRDEK